MTFLSLTIQRHRWQQPATIQISDGYYQVTVSSGVVLRLRQRDAYPRTFCVRQPDGSIFAGYGPQQPSADDEYLHIYISASGDVRMVRDYLVTLPLLYGDAG